MCFSILKFNKLANLITLSILSPSSCRVIDGVLVVLMILFCKSLCAYRAEREVDNQKAKLNLIIDVKRVSDRMGSNEK